MIFCKLEQLGRYRGLSQHLDTAIHFLEEGGASRLTMGRNEVDGEAVYVNRFGYDTAAEAITEGHIRYIDVHLVLSGQEQIGVADVSTLEEIDLSGGRPQSKAPKWRSLPRGEGGYKGPVGLRAPLPATNESKDAGG